jgi:hypothetical protein
LEPPFFVNTVIAAQDLYVRCRDEAVRVLKYPDSSKLNDLTFGERPEDSASASDEGARSIDREPGAAS